MTRRQWRPIAVGASIAVLVAVSGGLVTDLGPWYRALEQPSWNPPGWLFAPAWTIIYALVAYAGVTAWLHAPDGKTRFWIVALFGFNAVLNVVWSVVFFQLKRPDWALLEVSLLWLSILFIIVGIARVSRRATWALVPYLAWVTFAGALNWAVVQLNGPFQAT